MNQKKKGWEGRSPGALPNKRKGKKGCRSKIKKKTLGTKILFCGRVVFSTLEVPILKQFNMMTHHFPSYVFVSIL